MPTHPRTLEERLTAAGYYEMLASIEELRQGRRVAIENARSLTGEFLKAENAAIDLFDKEIASEEKLARDVYDANVRLVDSHNDLELSLMQLFEQAATAAEEVRKTDPQKAAKILADLGIDENGDLI